MSQSKKDGIDRDHPIENEDTIPPPPANPKHVLVVETPVRQIRDRVTFSTTFIEDVDLLAKYHLEYQQLMALHSRAPEYADLTFSQIKRNLLNVIDTHWDTYKRKFNIPDRLVALKFTSLDGDFYLGLENGYLCFYKDPNQRYRQAFPLVEEPFGVDRILPN